MFIPHYFRFSYLWHQAQAQHTDDTVVPVGGFLYEVIYVYNIQLHGVRSRTFSRCEIPSHNNDVAVLHLGIGQNGGVEFEKSITKAATIEQILYSVCHKSDKTLDLPRRSRPREASIGLLDRLKYD